MIDASGPFAVAESHVGIEAEGASMQTFVAHPADGEAHPVILFLMDAPGKRPLLHEMASTLASHGYYVMLPNLYYRTAPAFELDFASSDSMAQMVELMRGIGNRMVARDADALLGFADADPSADAAVVGTVGYCMSGPFAIWVAAHRADCVRAAASFYGVRLHVDRDDSPHRRLDDLRAEVYIGAAEHDDYVPLTMIDDFEAALQATDLEARVERYWGKHHGFAFDDRPAYDERSDARHWRRLLDLFARTLKVDGAPS